MLRIFLMNTEGILLYLENRILNKNLKYQKFVKLRYNKTSEEKLTKVSWRILRNSSKTSNKPI